MVFMSSSITIIPLMLLKNRTDLSYVVDLTISLYISQTSFDTTVGIHGCLVMCCSKYLHDHNYKKFWAVFYGNLLIFAALTSIPLLTSIYIKEILGFFGFEGEMYSEVPFHVRVLFFILLLEQVNSILTAILIT